MRRNEPARCLYCDSFILQIPSVLLLADAGCRIPWRSDPLVVVQLIICRVANPPGLWETACMTNQTTNQQQCFQHREDYKVHKLVERIEVKLALLAKANREAVQASPRN